MLRGVRFLFPALKGTVFSPIQNFRKFRERFLLGSFKAPPITAICGNNNLSRYRVQYFSPGKQYDDDEEFGDEEDEEFDDEFGDYQEDYEMEDRQMEEMEEMEDDYEPPPPTNIPLKALRDDYRNKSPGDPNINEEIRHSRIRVLEPDGKSQIMTTAAAIKLAKKNKVQFQLFYYFFI